MSTASPCGQDGQDRHATITDMTGETIHTMALEASTRVLDILNAVRDRNKRHRDCLLVHQGEVLKDAHASVQELGLPNEVALMIAAQDLCKSREEGWSAKRLKSSGFTADGLLEAGYSMFAVRHAGYSAEELFRAGYSPKELSKAGYDVASISRLVGPFLAAGQRATELKARGFEAKHLLHAGCGARELLGAGFSLKDLEKGVPLTRIPNLKALGVPAERLREAGYPAHAIKAAGYAVWEAEPLAPSIAEGRRVSWKGV
eukprot:TRINITY_DN60458_c0_g1_i1.p1 TRINITY_DN60458_c0_g1~~TRINITY_DN60458_c0_g1_i1.p1  ORF type:complete len:259 (-),score=26.62 TRINITY_DN60458_c0_g1_i1:513-1289(-)